MPTTNARALSPSVKRLENAINAFCETKWNQRKLSYLWGERDKLELIELVLTWLREELKTHLEDD